MLFFHPQFGEWAGQLGDGRAVMLGEYINRYTDMMQNLLVYENIHDCTFIANVMYIQTISLWLYILGESKTLYLTMHIYSTVKKHNTQKWIICYDKPIYNICVEVLD